MLRLPWVTNHQGLSHFGMTDKQTHCVSLDHLTSWKIQLLHRTRKEPAGLFWRAFQSVGILGDVKSLTKLTHQLGFVSRLAC